jgi:hypothetical protein
MINFCCGVGGEGSDFVVGKAGSDTLVLLFNVAV